MTPIQLNGQTRRYKLLYTLGSSYLEREHYHEADEKLTQLLELDPENPDICLKAAQARLGLREVSEPALELYEKAVSLNPDVESICLRLVELFNARNVESPFAAELFQRAVPDEQAQPLDTDDEHRKEKNVASNGKSRPVAAVKCELEELWWQERFDDARKLLAHSAAADIEIELAAALTEAYEHVAKGTRVEEKALLDLITDRLRSLTPDASLEALRDYWTLTFVLPEDMCLVKEEADQADAAEYEFILGQRPMEDFFGELQSPEEDAAREPNNDHSLLGKLGLSGEGESDEISPGEKISGFMLVEVAAQEPDESVPERLLHLIRSHLAGVPRSVLRQSGMGFVSLAVDPIEQIRSVVKLLRSLEKYNAATAQGRVKLLCAALTADAPVSEESRLRAALLTAIHLLRPARERFMANAGAGGILFAGNEASRDSLSHEGLRSSDEQTHTAVPGVSLACSEILWRERIEDANENRPFQLGEIEVRRRLARHGGYATLVARNKQLGRSMLLKALRGANLEKHLHDPAAKQALFDEIRGAGRLNHPNIATLFDMGEEEDVIYYTREFIEGRMFSEIDFSQPDWEFDFVEQLLKIVRALSYVHAQGRAHLNLKPSNIWLNEAQSIKIADIRLEAFRDQSPENREWRYEAPELLDGGDGDSRSDIYTLGLICYEILAQAHPYDLAGISEPGAIREKTLPEPRNEQLHFHEGWRELLQQMIAVQPDERQQDMTQIMAALRMLQVDLMPQD